MDLEKLREISRHKDIKSLLRYVHRSNKVKRRDLIRTSPKLLGSKETTKISDRHIQIVDPEEIEIINKYRETKNKDSSIIYT